MTTYSKYEIDTIVREELKTLRRTRPNLKIFLNTPPWFLHLDNQNTCLSIRYITIDENDTPGEGSYNVAI